MRTALLLLLLTACGPPPVPPAAPLENDDFLLGGIPATADTGEVRLSFGDPDSISAGSNPFAVEPLVTWHYPGFEIRFSGGVPVGVLILERGEQTARGLRVGDPETELRRRYGEPSVLSEDGWTYLEPAPLDGQRILHFLISNDTIRRIYIGRTL
jgi:hypothetical protein